MTGFTPDMRAEGANKAPAEPTAMAFDAPGVPSGKACGEHQPALAEAASVPGLSHLDTLGHLTGGIAHDFNNLLAVILGNSEILFDELKDPELKAAAELIMRTAERGATLTHRLLAFGRRQPLSPEPLDLAMVLRSISDKLNHALGKDIGLQVEGEAGVAYVDRSLFETAIYDLVLNAQHAMPHGGILRITTELVDCSEGTMPGLRPGRYVRVSVDDSGVGMSKDVLDRAFEPFFTTRRDEKASGLGLPMVYGFVKQSGGHVTVESEVGQGTSVQLYLPVAPEVASFAERPREPQLCVGDETILLVEDDPDVRAFVARQLDSLRYRVVQAATGVAALDALRLDPAIDLLFTDVVLPDRMSGFEVVRLAREIRPELKVLMTTGYAAEPVHRLADVKEAMLKKPYKKQQLAAALRDVLDMRPAGNGDSRARPRKTADSPRERKIGGSTAAGARARTAR